MIAALQTYGQALLHEAALAWPSERQHLVQLRRLRRLLRYAGRHVPFYRALFQRSGFDPQQVQSLDDLRHCPMITRAHLEGVAKHELLATSLAAAAVVRRVTGGTSDGRPFEVRLTQSEYHRRRLGAVVALRRYGARLWRRSLSFNLESAEERHPQAYRPRWYHALGLGGTVYCWPELSDEEWRIAYPRLRSELLFGDLPWVRMFAEFVERAIPKSQRWPVRSVVVTGESLSDSTRKWLADVFDAPVYDWYASGECGLIAWECRAQQGLHVDFQHVVVTPWTRTHRSRFSVTVLDAYAMPIINLDLGDEAAMAISTCDCGMEGLRMESPRRACTTP